MNFTGLWIGLLMLTLIGLGFLWVIKFEYYFGAKPWKVIFGAGVVVCIISLFVPSFWLSSVIGIFGASMAWGAAELPGQEERARRGLFPVNPKRAQQGASK